MGQTGPSGKIVAIVRNLQGKLPVQMYQRQSSLAAPLLLAFVAIMLSTGIGLQLVRGLPPIEASTTFPATTVLGQENPAPLPAVGASAVAVGGLGTIGSAGDQTPRPIASVTKIMTAYLILTEHPLQPGETGPLITITEADESRYFEMLVQDQSVQPVAAGLQFSQLDLLQGLLIPSANNFGEILAQWDSASVTAFVAKMNTAAADLGMTNTVYADVSGFLPGSVSTPQDQLILARVAMANPTFASIVGSSAVLLPHIGSVNSTNTLLGASGIVGIKTGYTEEAGGNLAFAARTTLGSRQVDIFGAVFGQIDRPAAFAATTEIVSSVSENLQIMQVLSRGQSVAVLNLPWSDPVQLVAADDAVLLVWPGMTLRMNVEYGEIRAPLQAGEQVGWIFLSLGEQNLQIPLILTQDLDKPGILWRLSRF